MIIRESVHRSTVFSHRRLRRRKERNANMSLLKCPKCGELFSDSYRECPFCLEDEEFHSGKKPKNPGRRVQKQKAPSILGPAMVVVVLLLAGFLVYTFLGDNFADWIDELKNPPVEDPVVDDPVVDDPVVDDPVVDDPVTPVDIALDKATLELKAGASATLTASGAEGIKWSSSDEAVAKVDETGKVTAVAAGSATVTASAENANSAACVVTVTAPPKDLEVVTEYGASLWSPNKAFSVSKGSSVDLKVAGTDSTPTWEIKDTDIASVNDEGVVKGKSGGSTDLIVKVDGQTIKIRVTVS